MKKIKLISILLAGMIITIDSVRAGAEGKKEVEIRYLNTFIEKYFLKMNEAKKKKKPFIEFTNIALKNKINAQQEEINKLIKIDSIELTGTVETLIGKINDKIKDDFQVSSVWRNSSLLAPTLFNEFLLDLDLSELPIIHMMCQINNKKINQVLLNPNLDLSNCSFKKDDKLLYVYLVPKSDEIYSLTPKIESRGWQYPRICSFCLTTILIFLIGAFCLYNNPSILKGEELERKSSWKCRWKAINAMRLSRMLFFILVIIVDIFFSYQNHYLASFGGYYYYLSNLTFGLLFLFLINLRCNDAKLSKWWLVPGVLYTIYELIWRIFPFKQAKIILPILIGIKLIDWCGLSYILISPSIPDEKKKAMKEEEEKEKEEDDTFINSTTDIAN